MLDPDRGLCWSTPSWALVKHSVWTECRSSTGLELPFGLCHDRGKAFRLAKGSWLADTLKGENFLFCKLYSGRKRMRILLELHTAKYIQEFVAKTLFLRALRSACGLKQTVSRILHFSTAHACLSVNLLPGLASQLSAVRNTLHANISGPV